MSSSNALLRAPPYAIDAALRRLGRDLKRARTRRGLTRAQVAEKIGTGVRAVADAEAGKPSTSIAVYVALLWVMGMLQQLAGVATPDADREGTILARAREPQRARQRKPDLDNDF